jgi:hypothetical protein
MKSFAGMILSALALLEFPSSPANAAGLPIVFSATVNSSAATLTVTGQNFGSSPLVTLDNLNFPTLPGSTSSTQIVATFPSGMTPASFSPGTYFLTIQYKNQLPSLFSVAIGATGQEGPQGVAGPAGVSGAQGIQGVPGTPGAPGALGPPGPAGATGIQGTAGPTGPAGPAGANGSSGPAGPSGSDGPAGANGSQGPAGPTGPTGPAGPPGSTPPVTCPASDHPRLLIDGRYYDCGDGTVLDVSTGLMWETSTGQSDGLGCDRATDPRCVSSQFHWSATTAGTANNGNLFTSFLQGLNTLVSADGISSNCFANHCDWRIPKVEELRGILLAQAPCSVSPCIDAVFGVSAPNYYWSVSSSSADPTQAWLVYFVDGSIITLSKGPSADPTLADVFSYQARAVRGGP